MLLLNPGRAMPSSGILPRATFLPRTKLVQTVMEWRRHF